MSLPLNEKSTTEMESGSNLQEIPVVEEGKEPKKISCKCSKKIVLSVIVFFFFCLLGYAYHLGSTNSNKEEGIMNSIQSGFEQILNGKNKEFNYSFFMDASFSEIQNGEKKSNVKIEIEDGSIISTQDGLQQRVKVGSISSELEYEEYGNDEKIEEEYTLKNLDIISDNQRIYLLLEEGMDLFGDIYGELDINEETIQKIKTTMEGNKYVMIDNSKPFLRIFGKLAENELMREFLIGLVTSNPNSYYVQNGVNQKLQDYFNSDKILDYIFVEGETDSVTNKTALLINAKLCKDYAPVIIEATKEFGMDQLVYGPNVSAEEIIEVCEQQVSQINQFLPMFTQIYKEGDSSTGNFKLVIAQGNLLDIQIDYKEHAMDTRYVAIQDPTEQVVARINGQKDTLLSSNLKLNLVNDQIKVTGEIVDGNGQIVIEGKQEEFYEITGTIDFIAYVLTNYDIVGNAEQFGMKAELQAKGSVLAGDINFLATAQEEEIAKFTFDYEGNGYNLDYSADGISAQSSYKEKRFEVKLLEKGYDDAPQTDLAFVYDNGAITSHLKTPYEEATMTGQYNSIDDFNGTLTIGKDDGKGKGSVIVTAVGDINKKVDYKLEVVQKGKRIVELHSSFERSSDDGFDIYDIAINGGALDDEGEVDEGMEVQFKFGLKSGGAHYEIPENFEELEIKLNEMITLPDFSSIGRVDVNTQTAIITGVTVGGVLATTAFISLQGYSADARNSKRISDVRNMSTAIQLGLIKSGEVALPTFIVRNEQYEGKRVVVGGKVLTAGEDYFVGTPNYIALGMNGSDVMDPDGSEYIIGVSTAQGGVYEILGKTEESSYLKMAYISGNYTPRILTVLNKGEDFDVIGSNQIKLDSQYVSLLNKGDLLSGLTVTKKSSDGLTYTFDKAVTKDKLILPADSKGLIHIRGKSIQNDDFIE